MIALYRLAATLLAPLVALAVVLHPRLRKHARERLGFASAGVEPGALWVHAASLGEGRAAAAIVAAARRARPDLAILRTCTSDHARDQDTGADETRCLPVDVPLCVGAWLDRTRPRALVLVEAELWPALLHACRSRGIHVVVAGARVGPGLARARAVPGLVRALTRGVVVLPADAAAAAALGGAPLVDAPLGELKREAPTGPPVLRWTRTAVVAGSTHPGDEAALLDAVALLAPRPLLVLAPRDPGCFAEVAALLEARGVPWARRTALRGEVPTGVDAVLLDTVGELAGLYAGAAVAFVGGTFDAAVGGHSPAEAQAAGCVVVHGPAVANHAARFAEGARVEASGRAALGAALRTALATPRPAPRAAGGAATAVLAALLPALDGPTPAERPLRPWLWPLAPAWLLAVALRPRPARATAIPVVAVGALTAGGAGKTPVAAHLAERLAPLRPAVVARGYGRAPGAGVRTEGEADQLGHELAMLARRGLVVVSVPDRVAGVAAAAARGAGVAVLDDALQVGSVARALEVVVVDARWPTGGGPIPVGTRRVPLAWLGRADVVWVNHGPLPAALAVHLRPDALVVEARYRPVAWLHRGQRFVLTALPARPAVAFAGIARPEGFFRLLRGMGLRLDRAWPYPDHHAYDWSDLHAFGAWMDDHVVLTTEKDAARLPPDANVYALVVEPEIVSGGEALDARLGALLRAAAPGGA